MRSTRTDVRNVAIIAHVDHGKTTLVDQLLRQSGVFRANQEVVDRVMDSNDIERERGITILSKNTAVNYDGVKINIIDTPGHADFGGEVERVLKMVNGVVLVVDAFEGTMPQTRFVLKKALELSLDVVVCVNKCDRPEARPDEVVDEVLELLMDLDATDQQLECPFIFASARGGWARTSMDSDNADMKPLFEAIINHIPAPEGDPEAPTQILISTIDYNEYVGRIGVGKVDNGSIRVNQEVAIVNHHEPDKLRRVKIGKLYEYEGLNRVEVKEAEFGSIVAVSGISDLHIGDTITSPESPESIPFQKISEPTISMNFMVNSSPFAGKVGKFVTSRHIKERLEKELEVNVGLVVEPTDSTDSFKVSGRGELHLSILIENMRREGYELAVSKPEVVIKRGANGEVLEPVEEVVVSVPDEHSGSVISKLNIRKGMMKQMMSEGYGYSRIEYSVPTRGLMGYRSEFINDTHGEGTMVRRFDGFEPWKGEIPERTNGVAVAQEEGNCTPYAIFNIQERVQMFVEPGTHVYEGMIVGMNSRGDDMVVNPCKAKRVSNMRAAGSDDTIKLTPQRTFTLEEALEFINGDEVVEVTPEDIRLRKKLLREIDRRKAGNRNK